MLKHIQMRSQVDAKQQVIISARTTTYPRIVDERARQRPDVPEEHGSSSDANRRAVVHWPTGAADDVGTSCQNPSTACKTAGTKGIGSHSHGRDIITSSLRSGWHASVYALSEPLTSTFGGDT